MSMIESIVKIFAPYPCLSCGAEGNLLCRDCCEMLPMHPEICWSCRGLSLGFRTCPACRRRSPLKNVFIAGMYEGALRDAIHALKFGRATSGAEDLGRLLIDRLPRRSIDLVVPIPAATGRQRRRGYNPASLIAQFVARERRIRFDEALGRLGQQRQVGAKREQRLTQLEGLYYVTSPRVRGARILLIDDVMTTGATLAEAARTLKAAGARSIEAAVLARSA